MRLPHQLLEKTLVLILSGIAVIVPRTLPASQEEHDNAIINAPDVPRFSQFRVGSRNVKSMLVDGDTLWVGTSGGVVRYIPEEDDYKLYDIRSGLLANGVFRVAKLNGRLAVGTYGGGLAIMMDETPTWKLYNIPEGMGDAFAYDMIQVENGDIWIATWSGANRIQSGKLDDPDSWDLFTVGNTGGGLPNDWVYSIREGLNGDIWLATEGGLTRFNDGEWQHWTHDDGLGANYAVVKDRIDFRNDPANQSNHHARQKVEQGLADVSVAYNPNYVVALLVDQDGNVWCGTWGAGLSRFDGERWQTFTTQDGLPSNHVFSLFQDNDGFIWAGTGNGVSRLMDGVFTNFGVSDGLISNSVFAMAQSGDGSTWIGSYGGVTRYLDPLQ